MTTIETVLRLANNSTVKIVIRRAPSDPCEWEPVSIDGVAPWYWLASMQINLAGTSRETKEKHQQRDARKRLTGVI